MKQPSIPTSDQDLTPDQSVSTPTSETDSAPAVDTTTPTAESVLTAQIAELTNDLQRTRADFENFRKQVELQRQQAISVARYATVEQFLPLIDDMERALAAYPEQLQPLAKSFQKTLDGLNLVKINSDPGTEFNPDFHEAVSVDEAGGDVEVISETLRPGYLYNDTVIRPAMVKVKH